MPPGATSVKKSIPVNSVDTGLTRMEQRETGPVFPSSDTLLNDLPKYKHTHPLRWPQVSVFTDGREHELKKMISSQG